MRSERRLVATVLLVLLGACGGASAPRAVEAGCGKCMYDLQDADCALAVRIDGRVLRVVGVDIDALGDAHAADGLCNAVRTARASGLVEGDEFRATKIELLPVAAK